MSKATSDGLARVQSESRIPASTWREWCNRLELARSLAVEVWDEICNPMRTASGQPPDVTFILQLRATRPDTYIDDFRDELPSILLTSQLLEAMGDDDFAAGRGKAALMRLYRHLGKDGFDVVTRSYLVHVGCLLLLPFVLPGDLTFRRLVRSISDGKFKLDDLLVLARKRLPGHEAEEEIIACFDAGMALLMPPARPAPIVVDDDDDDEDDVEPDDPETAVGDNADTDGSDAEADVDDVDLNGEDGVDEDSDDTDDGPDNDPDNDSDEEDDEPSPAAGPEGEFIARFREALALLRDGQGSLTEELTACLDRFDPFHVRIPSMEEARRIAARVETGRSAAQRAKSGKRPVLSAPSGGVKVSGARPSGGGSRPSGGGGVRPSGGRSSAGSGPRPTASVSPSTIGVAVGASASASASGSTSAAGTASSASVSSGGGTESETATADSSAASGSPAAGPATAEVTADASGTGAAGAGVAPEMKEDGKLAVPRLRKDQLNAAVKTVSGALAQLEATDPRAWKLFGEPDGEIEHPKALAEELVTDGSPAQQALNLLRVAAQQQMLKPLLELPVDQRLKERRFDLEAQAWLNAMVNNRRELDPDARQLIPVPKVLDYSAAALLRLEALRAAVQLVQEADDVDTLTPAMVTESYENFLGDVSYLADHERLNVARPKADADAAVVLEAVAAEAFIERLSANSVAWIQDLIAAEATESVDATEAAVKDTPLQIENTRMAEDTDQEAEPTSQMAESTDQEAEPKSQMAESTGPIPPDLLEDALLGGIVETIRQHVLRTVWPLLAPRHQPEETARRLDVEVRRELRAFVRMEPRRERHQKNPKVALPVTSLERLTGNPDLGHLFIRLSELRLGCRGGA